MPRPRRNLLRTTLTALSLSLLSGLLLTGTGTGPSAAADNVATAATETIAAAPTVKGKVYAGYQGWFAAPGDGSPVDNWVHWAAGRPPSPGDQTFEMYPEMTGYPASAQFRTGYAALGNGSPSTLFSSHQTTVVDKHFQWMQQYGIDGAALQRFGSDIANPTAPRALWRDQVTTKARDAAQKYGRGFYVEYDVSGLNDANVEQVLKDDWTKQIIGTLKLTDSPAYAREGGKPVVEIWGLGFTDRPGTAETAVRVVNWFKSQGLYVIGGVPRGWRDDSAAKPGFGPVYKAFNMISPWMVGSTGDTAPQLAADLAATRANGQDYLPVIYPGFSWANWNGGARNQIPRRAGDFMWTQAANVRKAGIPQAFIAMFDEYDEATNIAPSATDSSMIPTDQYFQTTSADGKFTSSDFYLRLAGKATRMITNQDPLSNTVPIPLSTGPVFFRTSVEQETDARLTWTNSPGPGGTLNVTGPTLGTVTGADHQLGRSAIRAQGSTPAAGHSYAYMQAFEVSIPITAATKLSYGFLPKDAGGRNVSVDLVLSDGTTLRDSAATSTTGQDMHPGTAKGTVGSWSRIQSNIGTWLNGRTITKILVGYDRSATGGYQAFIDNIEIAN
ncbi:hypothetical protein GCM10011583_32230 [Streptomyces camponoticapitis]|uniref:Xylosidase/arabinosidase n=1 Tax=Streptomyces camponoticapitis TaxID=1616125 RepID=A0ABQ2E711_9ACTN|nr:glycoside hydrolase family 71/99-like protein [Streptomyces camponoticapitis]GGJ98295.1 hypothetical protein GCM10011583_32230 [Streptomyces camponoticapitis]